MNDLDDQRLLRDYASHHSEAAFAELVRRHVDFVYSAARRMVGDPHLAEDVAQGTFVALAQNATALAGRPVLTGWLHRTTRNISAQTVRTEVRRRVREQAVAVMNEPVASEPDAWKIIAPELDAALTELAEPDRDALLLRYFERQSAHAMALRLGISDEAAQKRVSRAVERLRECLARRGLPVGAGTLATVLAANAIQAAPVGLTAAIVSASALIGTSAMSTATIATTKTMAMTTLHKTLVTVMIAGALGAGIYEGHQAAIIRSRFQALQQQQAPLAGQARLWQDERDTARRQLAALQEENDRLHANTGDLLRLRDEVTRLRQEQAAMNTPSATPSEAAASPVGASSGPSPADSGRELGVAVVQGEPGAMKKILDLAQAEEGGFKTNSAGLNEMQRNDLSREIFAPLLAAFDVIASAAAKGSPTAMDAVVQAIQVPELMGPGVSALGTMAGAGNQDALNALLNYQQYNLPLSTVVGALQPAADTGNAQAIQALAAVVQDPDERGLWYLVAAGLDKAAASGNGQAIDTLITLSGDPNASIQRAAISGLRLAAANQNARAANALQALGNR